MVINVGALLSGERDSVLREIATVAATCHAGGALLKVIIETCLLTDELKRIACRLAKDADADFVKTSTGFARSGATAEDVALMRETVGDQIGIKASGGIRTIGDLERMVAAGATRIGASASVAIIQSLASQTTE
jgi:deoxyribose-phosphate aldolase